MGDTTIGGSTTSSTQGNYDQTSVTTTTTTSTTTRDTVGASTISEEPSQAYLDRLGAGRPGVRPLVKGAVSLYFTEVNKILDDTTLTPTQKEAAVKQAQANLDKRLLGILGEPYQAIRANPWFSPNMMVALAINLTDMAKMMKLSRITELAAKLEGMNMVWDSGKNIAALGYAMAQAEASMKMMEGAAGVMTAAGGFATAGAAGMAGTRYFPNLTTFMTRSGGGGACTSIVSGSSQAITGFINSGLTMTKAESEQLKAIAETLKQLESQQLQSSGEAMSDLESNLTKALDMMQKIWERNLDAQKSLKG